MKTLLGRVALFAILLCVLYVGYRIYERNSRPRRHASRRSKTPSHPWPSSLQSWEAPTETITLPGNIQAWFQAPIYAQVSGYVKMWYKDYGALVKKGDVLAEINAPALDAQYEAGQSVSAVGTRQQRSCRPDCMKRSAALRKNHALRAVDLAEEEHAKAELAKTSGPRNRMLFQFYLLENHCC